MGKRLIMSLMLAGSTLPLGGQARNPLNQLWTTSVAAAQGGEQVAHAQTRPGLAGATLAQQSAFTADTTSAPAGEPLYGFGAKVNLNDIDDIVAHIAYPLHQYDPGEPLAVQGVIMGWAGVRFDSPLEYLPAVEALVKIGEPAVQPVLAKFGQTDAVPEQCCCLRVLVELKGKAQTERMLQEALTKTPEGPDRAHLRLKNSLDILRKEF